MIKDFQEKVAVITGGASGIGLCAAKHFLSAGMKVVIADISDEALQTAAEELNAGERLHTVICDVSNLESNESLAKEAVDRFGGINLAFFNAATLGDAGGWRASELSPKAWKQTLDVSLDGPFYGVTAFLPHLKQSDEAHICFTASAFSMMTGLSDPASYFAAKAGLLAYAECLHHDLTDRGSHVGVTTLLPGNTQTGPYLFLKELLEETENSPEDWDASTWGDRDYCRELADVFTNEGTPPDICIEALMKAVKENQFYVTDNIGDRIWMYIDERFKRFRASQNPQMPDKNLTIYRPLQAAEQ